MILRNEDIMLAQNAAHCRDTKGRAHFEEECSVRTAYQRDRDRIIHSNAFRRLKHKTQVFLSPTGDHYRTRLTHTLEVAQIARTIARALCLNEDLTEAIALGHDLGHTPFGHAGERALNDIMPGGFRHYEQSLRVVDLLEQREGFPFPGLNLTLEVRDGILCHTEGRAASTMEGRLVRLSDRIAYMNHDMDDAVRAGILSNDDVPEDIRAVLGQTRADRIDTIIHSVIENSSREIKMARDMQEAFDAMHQFMFDNVYTNPVCKGEETKVFEIISRLFDHYSQCVEELPPEYAAVAENESPQRAACDYISGMTDHFALKTYSDLYIPRSWAE